MAHSADGIIRQTRHTHKQTHAHTRMCMHACIHDYLHTYAHIYTYRISYSVDDILEIQISRFFFALVSMRDSASPVVTDPAASNRPSSALSRRPCIVLTVPSVLKARARPACMFASAAEPHICAKTRPHLRRDSSTSAPGHICAGTGPRLRRDWSTSCAKTAPTSAPGPSTLTFRSCSKSDTT